MTVFRPTLSFNFKRPDTLPTSEDPEAEPFGLSWPGKRAAHLLARQPSLAALCPATAEGINEGSTRNVFIEGDNLEALKLLQESHAGRVKMIYIDPPYNTGKDFVYRDNFRRPVEARSCQEGHLGEVAKMRGASGACSHANWLSMMYPRLWLSRNLLREDGAIFVSIDDHELANLCLLLDEVFGEGNRIAVLPWKGRGGRQASAYLAQIHEYVVFSVRDSGQFAAGRMARGNADYPRYDPVRKRRYKMQLARKWGAASRREDRPNLFYGVIAPDGSIVYPRLPNGQDGRWRFCREKMEQKIAGGEIEFGRESGSWIAYERIYEPREGEARPGKFSTWLDDVGSAANGTEELKALWDGEAPFDFPKPTTLIRRLMQIAAVGKDDIVLDFFAGSCTTADAVLRLNREDGGHRSFIMVQLPEPTPEGSVARRAGYDTVAEIGKERIRRVIRHMQVENAGDPATGRQVSEDLGFKVFKLCPPVEEVRYDDIAG